MAAGKQVRLRTLRTHDGPAEWQGVAALILAVRVSTRMTSAMAEELKPHGLTMPHFDVLMSLKRGEGISQQDLSERLLVTKGNICVMVQKIEAAGLIERRTDPTDQRIQRLYLTDAGRRLLAKIMPEHMTLMQKLLAGMTLEQQKMLHDLLARVDQNLDALEP